MPAFTNCSLQRSHVKSIQLLPFIFVNTRLLQKGGLEISGESSWQHTITGCDLRPRGTECVVFRFCFGGDSRVLFKNAFLGAYTVVEERCPWKTLF